MKIKWFGHASFLITSDSGIRIITDPYTPGDGLRYGEIKESADIVTVSHEHFDHNNTKSIKGNPVILRKSGEEKGISVKAVPAFHDAAGGKTRGKDSIFCFAVDGVRLCHLGDLGQIPDEKQISEMGKVDVLFIPAGGCFTLEPADATKTVENIKPRVVIPMHYQTDKTSLPFSGVDEFLKGKSNVKKLNGSEIEFTAATLPAKMEIIVLKPAL